MISQPVYHQPYGHKSRLIQEHNVFQNTDKLYDPLRDVLFHPDKLAHNSVYGPKAALNSMLTHQYHTLTHQQAVKIRQNIYIPVDRQLKPTHHLEKVYNNRFFVVDSQEKVLGEHISPQQIQHLKRIPPRQSRIVYQFDEPIIHRPPPPPPKPVVKSIPLPVPLPQPPKISTEPPKTEVVVETNRPKYKSPPIQQHKNNKVYKYNLYSIIDEPLNRARQDGCGSMTCPSNQIIASRNQPQSHNWLN